MSDVSSLENQLSALDEQHSNVLADLERWEQKRQIILTELDKELEVIQSNLSEVVNNKKPVYSALGNISLESLIADTAGTPEDWTQHWYQKLRELWDRYNIEIPPQEEIAPKLMKAYEV